MRNFVFVLVAAAVVTILAQRTVTHDVALATTSRSLTVSTSDDSTYASARTTIVNYIANYIQAHPTTSLTSVPGWSNGTATVTVTVDGDTQDAGATLTAGNVDTTASERRISLTLTEKETATAVPTSHRVIIRAYGYAPYADVLSDLPIGAPSDSTTIKSADIGGCNGSGTGCDTQQTTASDPSLLYAHTNCTLGIGSGVCPPSGYYDVTSVTNKSWTSN